MTTQWWNPSEGEPAAPTPDAPPMPAAAAPAQNSPSLLARTGGNAATIGLVAGLLSGAAGVGIGAALTSSADDAPAVVVGATTALLGFLISSWSSLTAGYAGRAIRQGLLGMVVAAAAGLGGLAVADALYQNVDRSDEDAVRQTLIIGWLAIGTLVGTCLGALTSGQKMISGLIGGALGGGAGGLLFVALDGTRRVDQALLIGVLVASTVIGTALGSVEQLRKRAWIRVIDGPQSGRELILYQRVNRVGADAGCHVALPGDPSMQAYHAEIMIDRQGMRIVPLGQAAVVVDGQPFAGGAIHDGAVVQAGSTFFSVHTK